MFIPTTRKEMKNLGWSELDVILITGDTYVDSSYFGISVIGHVLIDAGYRVGIIAQPDIESAVDIKRLGEPLLFWGINSGSVDSMVSNYTASKKRRNRDDLTPGGENNRRPDRALIAYTNLVKRYFKNTVPIVLGGIEASLRRVAHFDYWSNNVRRSILFDTKADYLVYGMGEKPILDLASALGGEGVAETIRGICYISKSARKGYSDLPSYEKCIEDKNEFEYMFKTFHKNCDAITAKGLVQKHGDRFLVQNPPYRNLTVKELDDIYNLPYERDVHPYYANLGEVRALETIKSSITTHRGCYGECNFCAIALHQGRTVISRSERSILEEADEIVDNKNFKGIIYDVGGPSANMYGYECDLKLKNGGCKNKRCIFPSVCKDMKVDHSRQTNLLKSLRAIKGVKKVFVASGVRYDLIFADEKNGIPYLEDLIEHSVSGQMKIAPEHATDKVLKLMGKPGVKHLRRFRSEFKKINRELDKKQFLTYYFIAAHPGSNESDMKELRSFVEEELFTNPEQIQIFTPTPSTFSTLMYYTEKDPFSGNKIYVEKDMGKKEKQKNILKGDNKNYRSNGNMKNKRSNSKNSHRK